MCKFCKKDQQHLKNHLKNQHSHEPEVIEMMRLDKETPRNSREPMRKLIYDGDHMYKTDDSLNQGDLRIARTTSFKRCAEEFTVCANCKITVLESEYRKHRVRCTGELNPTTRNINQEGRALLSFCSNIANIKMKKHILPRIRNDAVKKAIRYDDLIIRYGNELTCKLRGVQHKGNVITQLRRIGRLKLVLGLKKLEEMFFIDSEHCVKAIEKMAGYSFDEEAEFLKYPALATNLGTIVKCITETFHSMSIKKITKVDPELIKNWKVTFSTDYSINISRMAGETLSHNRRYKDDGLPVEGDPELLYSYLTNKIRSLFRELEEKYTEKSYLIFMKHVMTFLQIYNRRRPGDVERIFLNDYKCLKTISEVEQNEFSKLDNNLQDLAKEYSILKTRGKLNRDIKLLVPYELKICLDLIVKLRSNLDISPKNEYLFALPRTPTHEIRYPNGYVLLHRFAKNCGAKNPKKLRATTLRKDLATKCIKLNLNDNDLKDLAAFMGHHVDVHISHYRKQLVSRDVPLFVKFLEAATGNFNLPKEVENDSTIHTSITDEVELPEIDFDNTESSTTEQSSVIERKRKCTDEIASTQDVIPNKKTKTQRKKWSQEAIEKIHDTFGPYMSGRSKKAPSAREIIKMISRNGTIFEGRTDAAIRTWMSLNRKK
ncbi:hypothetical protein TKK_0002279 [Trichogramma kaykai]|uniref:Tyr recombinase domain-containing protein n=1 Tax=Trichogramma kaykai TaxID=54128 RepID=A0ABD2XAX5_9HYME